MNTEAIRNKTRVIQVLLNCIEEAMLCPDAMTTQLRLVSAIVNFGEATKKGRTLSGQDLLQAIQLITGEGKLEIRRALQESDYTYMGISRSGEKLLLDFCRWLFS